MNAAATTPGVWSRFWARPVARFFFCLLAVFYLGAAGAPFWAPYTESDQSLPNSFHPPSRLVWNRGLAVQQYEMADKGTREYRPIPGRAVPVRWFAEGQPYRWFGVIPCRRHLFGVDEPARIYLAGADVFGRDQVSRLLYGSQISLSIGLVGIAITTVLGLGFGTVAGYFGRFPDFLIMRATEVLMSIPTLYLILALRATFASDLSSTQIYLVIVAVLAFVGWAGTARVIRGMTLSLGERDFVNAARALGQRPAVVIARHIVPNVFSYVIVAATLSVPGYILGEAVLSFLGLGIQEPKSSWGLMLAQAQSIRVLAGDFWWMLLPGLLICLTVMAFNFVGDALRDAVDPRLRILR